MGLVIVQGKGNGFAAMGKGLWTIVIGLVTEPTGRGVLWGADPAAVRGLCKGPGTGLVVVPGMGLAIPTGTYC